MVTAGGWQQQHLCSKQEWTQRWRGTTQDCHAYTASVTVTQVIRNLTCTSPHSPPSTIAWFFKKLIYANFFILCRSYAIYFIRNSFVNSADWMEVCNLRQINDCPGNWSTYEGSSILQYNLLEILTILVIFICCKYINCIKLIYKCTI